MSNKLVKGTLILSILTLFTKIIGSLFWAPFQNIAGDETVGIYRISFPFYSILLMIATAGIPITVSKFVAEHLSQDDYPGARRVLRVASLILTLTGILSFCILFFGAEYISKVILGNSAATSSMKVLACAILFVPIMGAYRGFFQGQQQMVPTGISQLIEQIVRVGVLIGLTYWMVQEGMSLATVAAGATAGALFGAIAGLMVMLWYNQRDKKEQLYQKWNPPLRRPESFRRLSKKIITYAIPISLATLVLPLIGLIDSFTVPRLLMDSGLTDKEATEWFGIYGRGEPFVNVISVFSSSLTLALIPAIAAHMSREEYEAVEHKISQSWLMTLVISLPASLALAVLVEPLNIAMYKDNNGGDTLAILAFSAIFSTLAVTCSGILQGLGFNKLPVRHLLIGAGVKVIANFLFIPTMGIRGSALAMVLAYIVVCGLNLWQVVRITGIRFRFGSYVLKPFLSAGIMLAILYLFYKSMIFLTDKPSRLFYIFISLAMVLIGSFVYLFALIITRTLTERDLSMIPMGGRIITLFTRLRILQR
ncbi:polysaccharide biosynthesis protein [Thermoactinomyces sp. DSM 45892]|uniref:putative polysaccharide biosynthesis protein n=1 Tax=Thermoactinomyces sp. DSM 45892 TaxID=1882753 RepID=UPI00089CC27C|nr:polysaccharide biosynthesis protein [Thermoactinomyces sp. DSM 45892]SDY58310.1 polysaccharide transporter, PST family [Thermoactinomyces sp. DSM 45892]